MEREKGGGVLAFVLVCTVTGHGTERVVMSVWPSNCFLVFVIRLLVLVSEVDCRTSITQSDNLKQEKRT